MEYTEGGAEIELATFCRQGGSSDRRDTVAYSHEEKNCEKFVAATAECVDPVTEQVKRC